MNEECFYFSIRDLPEKKYSSFDELHQLAKKKKVSNVEDGFYGNLLDIDWMTDFIGAILLFIFPGCLLWIWIPIIYVLYSFVTNPTSLWSWVLLGLLLWSSFGPVKFYWKEGMTSWVSHTLIKYFSFQGAYDEPLEPEKYSYILVAPPHGVFPFGNLLAQTFWVNYANFHFSPAAASVLFYIPVVRHVMTWMGCVHASSHDIQKSLNNKKTIGLSTGGIAELFESHGDVETIVLKNRKGFVRIAMKTGAKIVPCYLFGNTQALKCLSDDQRVMAWISRKIKASITFFWGRFGLPIAFRTPIFGVMAKPISVPKVEGKIDEKEVDAIHSKVVEEIVKLFDKHKAAYGWSHKILKIK